MPMVDHLTWTQIQFVVEALYNTDIHELPMPGDRPEWDRYQKEENKFLSIFCLLYFHLTHFQSVNFNYFVIANL